MLVLLREKKKKVDRCGGGRSRFDGNVYRVNKRSPQRHLLSLALAQPKESTTATFRSHPGSPDKRPTFRRRGPLGRFETHAQPIRRRLRGGGLSKATNRLPRGGLRPMGRRLTSCANQHGFSEGAARFLNWLRSPSLRHGVDRERDRRLKRWWNSFPGLP